MAAGKIDLAQFGPNTLRHVTASYLVAGGIPPAAIMSRAGWTSYSTFLKFYNLQMANNNWSTMIIQAAGMQGEVVGSGSCPSTAAHFSPTSGGWGSSGEWKAWGFGTPWTKDKWSWEDCHWQYNLHCRVKQCKLSPMFDKQCNDSTQCKDPLCCPGWQRWQTGP